MKRMGAQKYMREAEGSITVFLTLIFGVIFAVVTAAFENVRFLTADAYMMSSARAAVVSVLGEYNRELYQEYGLLGYGGYDGIGVSELSECITGDLSENLRTAPESDAMDLTKGYGMWDDVYTSLYRISEAAASISQAADLTESRVFYRQIEAYLQTQMVTDLTDKITGAYRNIAQADQSRSIDENLDMTGQYEKGVYDKVEDTAADASEADETDVETEPEASMAPDHAGGNPLESFRELLRDGVLNLVCDADALSKEEILSVYSDQKMSGVQHEDLPGDSTSDILKSMLKEQGSLPEGDALKSFEKQGKLICYAQHVFPDYINSGKQHYQYGLEYLISGSKQERDNLQGVLGRLMLIRTILNYAYVHADAGLQAESLATATKLAGALGLPVLIGAIQQTILLILSVEESCIDITALLEGKSVPLVKNATNFQMKYPEICTANKVLFQTKAKKYKGSRTEWVEGEFNYQQYLWLLLLMVPEQALRLRTCDLIQNDLQSRYQPTFSLQHCISGFHYQIQYRMPFLWEIFLPKGQDPDSLGRVITSQYYYR